ncbi:MAG: HEPN domain-containing protein [Gemmataceae bacterium]
MRPFLPEHYFQAATERLGQAQHLYTEGKSYALSMYIAEVAIECLLRAFKGLSDLTFDEKHDLLKLFHASRIARLTVDEMKAQSFGADALLQYQKELQASVSTVYLL